MNTFFLGLTFFFLGLFSLSAQNNVHAYFNDSSTYYTSLDTLSFYNVSIRAETAHNATKYWVNDKRVDQATYEKYKTVWDNIDKCRPCYFKTYDVDDVLLYEGPQCTDCRVGSWVEYYPSGALKIRGHYKENSTDNWEDLWKRKLCSVKHGKWITYGEDEEIQLIEVFWNGKLVLEGN
jgi:hypothetical protein